MSPKPVLVVLVCFAACDGPEHRTSDGGLDLSSTSDAGLSDSGVSKITLCPQANQPPLASGTCQITAGSEAKLITATLLTPGEVLRGGQLLVDASGKIACVGCDCSAP